jgi:hypothetical protein
MKKTRLILYLITIVFIFLSCVNPGLLVHANLNEPPPFGDFEPFIDGSNQEWAIEMLSISDNSEEKIRYYKFLLRAYTFLMRYDEQNYNREYYEVKELWLDFLEVTTCDDIEQILEDKTWTIDIFYPLERPFTLTLDEFTQVFLTFKDANPQFMSHPMFTDIISPFGISCDIGVTPGLSVKAYWAFAERRQEAYHNFIDAFEPIPWQPRSNLGVRNEQPVIIHISSYQGEVTEETWNNIELLENYESNQGTEASRANLILLFFLGVAVLLVINISSIRHRKTVEEPEIHVQSFELNELEKKINIESMITIHCDFCGARNNIVKGKSEICPYCDCIIRDYLSKPLVKNLKQNIKT